MNKYIFKIYQHFIFKKRGYSVSPYKIFDFLNKSQYWSQEKMRKHQLNLLNNLVVFSKKSSSYYSDKFKNVKLPFIDFKAFNDQVSEIDKADIVKNINELKTKNFTNKYHHSTSGSTGDPLSAYISEMAEIYRKAGMIRFKDWWGIKPHEKSVLIWRYQRENENLMLRIKTYFRSRYDVNVYGLNDNTILKHFEYIENFQPTSIRGYKSGVLEFAELLDKNKLKFKKAKFKVVIVTAELLYKSEREFIERTLNCKVANEYGSADGGLFAYECPQGSMHIYEEAVYLEIDRNSSVVVTELHNNSMPFIRYKNKDELVISEEICKCGRTSRTISELKGRVSGYIILPDGRKLNQGIFIDIFMGLHDFKFNSVKKFKVYQEKMKFRIKIVPLENFNKDCEEFIRKAVSKRISNDFEIDFEIVQEIEREKSGKLVFFVQNNKTVYESAI